MYVATGLVVVLLAISRYSARNRSDDIYALINSTADTRARR
jgi:hypothetical protein